LRQNDFLATPSASPSKAIYAWLSEENATLRAELDAAEQMKAAFRAEVDDIRATLASLKASRYM
jgi:hypothetical protein